MARPPLRGICSYAAARGEDGECSCRQRFADGQQNLASHGKLARFGGPFFGLRLGVRVRRAAVRATQRNATRSRRDTAAAPALPNGTRHCSHLRLRPLSAAWHRASPRPSWRRPPSHVENGQQHQQDADQDRGCRHRVPPAWRRPGLGVGARQRFIWRRRAGIAWGHGRVLEKVAPQDRCGT